MPLPSIRMLSSTVLVAALAAGTSGASAATVVFADSFDDADVSDWTKSTNYGGTSNVTVWSDALVSPGFALYTYLDAPPGGVNLMVQASHAFVAPVAGDYLLELSARSSPCSGCTISYDVIVDGNRLTRTFAPTSFESRSFTLAGLTSGSHTLSLGVHTTNASSGRFNASFDDVVISTTAPIPEPGTWALMLGGLGLVAMAGRRRHS